MFTKTTKVVAVALSTAMVMSTGAMAAGSPTAPAVEKTTKNGTYVGTTLKKAANKKTVKVAASTTKIAKGAFKGCKKVKTVKFASKKKFSISKKALKGLNKKVTIKLSKKMSKKDFKAMKKAFKKAGFKKVVRG